MLIISILHHHFVNKHNFQYEYLTLTMVNFTSQNHSIGISLPTPLQTCSQSFLFPQPFTILRFPHPIFSTVSKFLVPQILTINLFPSSKPQHHGRHHTNPYSKTKNLTNPNTMENTIQTLIERLRALQTLTDVPDPFSLLSKLKATTQFAIPKFPSFTIIHWSKNPNLTSNLNNFCHTNSYKNNSKSPASITRAFVA